MDPSRQRILIMAGTTAALLAAGPASAQEQQADRVGRASIPSPEWQFYAKEMDPRYGPLAWLTFDQVIGSQVEDEQGQAVGEIVNLVRAKADGAFYAVMEPSGAGEPTVVPVGQLKVVGDEDSPELVYASQEPISAMPAYDAAQYEVAQPAE